MTVYCDIVIQNKSTEIFYLTQQFPALWISLEFYRLLFWF